MFSISLLGTILGSFYYGYLVLQIPGGYLAYRFGGTRVFGISLFAGSLMTMLTPFVARMSVIGLIVLRVMEGVFLVSNYIFLKRLQENRIIIGLHLCVVSVLKNDSSHFVKGCSFSL